MAIWIWFWAGGSGASLHFGDGTGMFTPGFLPNIYASGLLATNGFNAVADVIADGIPDILVSGSDTLYFYLGHAERELLLRAPHLRSAQARRQEACWSKIFTDSRRPDYRILWSLTKSGGVMVLLNLTQ